MGACTEIRRCSRHYAVPSLSPDTRVRGGHRPRRHQGLAGSPPCWGRPDSTVAAVARHVCAAQGSGWGRRPSTQLGDQYTHTQFSQKSFSGQPPDSNETQPSVCDCYPKAPGREALWVRSEPATQGPPRCTGADSLRPHAAPARLQPALPDLPKCVALTPAAALHLERLRVTAARAQSACASRWRGTPGRLRIRRLLGDGPGVALRRVRGNAHLRAAA